MTRKFITFTTLLLLATAGFSKQPPAAVLKTFGEKFPGITKVAWSKENAREWEAEFLINNKKTSATFAVDGTWKETEITTGEIPSVVTEALHKKYDTSKIMHPKLIERPGGVILYEIEIKTGLRKKEVKYSKEGQCVK